jgi:integrase
MAVETTTRPVSRRQFDRKAGFRRLIKAADVRRIKFYDLRHGVRVAALAAHTPPKVVQERLGRKDTAPRVSKRTANQRRTRGGENALS